jgi:hypothetical protein
MNMLFPVTIDVLYQVMKNKWERFFLFSFYILDL